jgi:allantoinase
MSTTRKRFTNLRIPSGGNDTEPADIVVADGKIMGVAPSGSAPAEADEEVLDLEGRLVLPGAIDGHVHFDDPGFTHREDFGTGTRAAAAGGVTCIVDMPCTSLPPVTSGDHLRQKLDVIRSKAHVDFMLWGGVSENAMDDPEWRRHLEEIASEGVSSIKVYMLSGMETFRDLGQGQIVGVLRETRRLGVPVGVHAETREVVHDLTRRLQAEGRNDPLDYAASRPEEQEVAAVETMRDLCRETGAAVHIVHLASGRGVDVLGAAHAEGLPMTAETCPQYLEFTVEDLATQGALLKTAPVVKSPADRDRLWQGVATGEIQHVATDHAAGQWPEEKRTGSIWTDYGGVPGVELLLPYLFSEGVGKGHITLERLTEIVSSAPARFFGVERRKGRIAAGFDADLTVLELGETWTVRSEMLHNLNRYTPLDGRELTGRVQATFLRGEPVYQREADGVETFGPAGYGAWVRRETKATT